MLLCEGEDREGRFRFEKVRFSSIVLRPDCMTGKADVHRLRIYPYTSGGFSNE